MTIKLVGDTFDASAKVAQEFTVDGKPHLIDPFDDAMFKLVKGPLPMKS